MATYSTILTNKGLQLIAAAGASGTPIVLTDMAVGDGNGNPVTPNPAQTSLARERYRHAVNQLTVSVNDPTLFTAELIIPAEVGGFTMREVGLYTAEGDLFAVANVPNAYKPTPAEGSFGDTVVRMMLKVANASVVTIVFDPNVTVATHTWVMNNVNAASMIPGGLTNQFLAKKSNADGDVEWKDPTEGVTVIVFSREETQTLAAGQTNIDLAQITAEGAAVYIEGTRLRSDEFSMTGPARITLTQAHPAGTKVTCVQNEEVGLTEMLLRPNNLSDVPDKAAARLNLGLPNWLAGSSINWSQLVNLPDYATRWPTWGEVTGKPATYAPSAHQHAWGDITGAPDTATRWPTWNEVTSKPSLYPPAAHSHAEYVAKSGDTMSGNLTVPNLFSSGSVFVNQLTSNDSTQGYQISWNIAGAENGYGCNEYINNFGGGGGGHYFYTRALKTDALRRVMSITRNGNVRSTPVNSGPQNGVPSFGYIAAGQYGGGYGLIDGPLAYGMYMASGSFIIGYGSDAGALTPRMSIDQNGQLISYGALSATGDFSVGGSCVFSNGGVRTTEGTLTNAGYVSFFTTNGSRRGYIGWNDGSAKIQYSAENGFTGHSFVGTVVASGGFDFGSSRKLKDIDGPMPYGLAEVRQITTLIGRYKPEYNPDNRARLFFDAEQFMEVMPEVVDPEGVFFNGESVPSIKIDQALPPVYRAVAELAELVDQLRAEIKELKEGR